MGEGGGKDHDGNHPRDAGDGTTVLWSLGPPQALLGASYSFFYEYGEEKEANLGK